MINAFNNYEIKTKYCFSFSFSFLYIYILQSFYFLLKWDTIYYDSVRKYISTLHIFQRYTILTTQSYGHCSSSQTQRNSHFNLFQSHHVSTKLTATIVFATLKEIRKIHSYVNWYFIPNSNINNIYKNEKIQCNKKNNNNNNRFSWSQANPWTHIHIYEVIKH